ncbi:MAG: DUF503 domain-containing protein [Sorangiineae bacterium]|nr:DUF503 domain-containing protein [Polyangiaceae bacterium]MEB2323111.1 DUF503 domain-containing protein [Sorangiineae bacterium]
MFVGVARIVLSIPGARSLKDRRRAVRSFKDRARARLPVSVAEVGDVELHQRATLGVAVVSGDASRCRETLARVAELARSLADARVAELATELIPFGDGGRELRASLAPFEGLAGERFGFEPDEEGEP